MKLEYFEFEKAAVSLKTVNAESNFTFTNIYKNIDDLAELKKLGSTAQGGVDRPIISVELHIGIPRGYNKGNLNEVIRVAEDKLGKNSVRMAQDIHYNYDPSGNRIGQFQRHNSGSNTKYRYTWYVRDAQGNVLAVYKVGDVKSVSAGTLQLAEHHLYGSSRLGIINRNLDADQPKYNVESPTNLGDAYLINFTRGNKLFEMSNHLGNVMLTFTDTRLPQPVSGNPTLIGSYKSDVVTAVDYSPFGMSLPGRTINNHWQKYRYGFNGKESDNEVNGPYNELDYGMRVYDPWVGRFLSVDPLTKAFPWYTPYQYAGNKPILCVDLDGLEDLPYSALNKYGEKQVYETTSTTEYGSAGPISIQSHKNVPQHAQPATKGMTEIQVYQLAFKRFAEPGKYLVGSNKYVDERLMKAEQQVQFFFNNNVPDWSSSESATNTSHSITAAGLLLGDESSMKQVQKSDDFTYRHSIGAWLSPIVASGVSAILRISIKEPLNVTMGMRKNGGYSRSTAAMQKSPYYSSWKQLGIYNPKEFEGWGGAFKYITDKVLLLKEKLSLNLKELISRRLYPETLTLGLIGTQHGSYNR